jgi:hypothetical protein
MKRSITFLFWMLLGAAASAAGVGYFFHQANVDRQRLVIETQTARDLLAQTKAASQKLADEANKKLADASKEVADAQQALKLSQEENALRNRAVALVKPDARTLRSWLETIHLPLGISLRLPTAMQTTSTNNALAAFLRTTSNQMTDQWLSISAYDKTRELDLKKSLKETEPLVYQVQNRLLIGMRGKLADLPGIVYVLRVGDAATSTHLIWARTNAAVTDEKVLDVLATLSFRS